MMKDDLRKILSKKVNTILIMLHQSQSYSINTKLDWWDTSILSKTTFGCKQFQNINLLKQYYKDIEKMFLEKGVRINISKDKFQAFIDTSL